MEYIKDIVPTVLMLLEYHILITQIMKHICMHYTHFQTHML